nr:hypothetical protein HK105_007024 [Polyrhizophydium stewartii]
MELAIQCILYVWLHCTLRRSILSGRHIETLALARGWITEVFSKISSSLFNHMSSAAARGDAATAGRTAADDSAAAAQAATVPADFSRELLSLYELKPPVSASKIAAITKLALHYTKQYKAIVHGIEKFVLKCRPEHKLTGLYVIDSIVRASLRRAAEHQQQTQQYGAHSVFVRRFEEKLDSIFLNLAGASTKDKERMKRVLGLWLQSGIFKPDLLTTLDETYFLDTNSATGSSRKPGKERDHRAAAAGREGGDGRHRQQEGSVEKKEPPPSMAAKLSDPLFDFDYGDEDDEGESASPAVDESSAAWPRSRD